MFVVMSVPVSSAHSLDARHAKTERPAILQMLKIEDMAGVSAASCRASLIHRLRVKTSTASA
jgi:hypothetical protein